nr:MAG TPA: SITE SPECIFIC RECOMBINASE XERD [Caudoviricetes sp.]
MNELFVMSLKAKHRSEGTIREYSKAIDKCLNYVNKPEAEIKAIDLEMWQSSMDNLSSASVAQRTSAVREYFKFLYRNEFIQRNPAEFLEAPAIKNREQSALTGEQVRAMVNAATNRRNKAIIMTLAQTGLRIHELLNITLEQYESRANNVLVIRGKGDKDRFIGLGDETIKLIDSYITNERKDGCEYLFVGNQGNKMDSKNTSAMLKVCARKAGIENWEELHISNHTMRRTFATMMSEADVPIEVISKAMGHSSIAITANRYIKRTEQRAINAMSVMNF